MVCGGAIGRRTAVLQDSERRPIMLKDTFAALIDRAVDAISKVYGDRLVSVVLYGSVGRGTMRKTLIVIF